LLNFQSLLEKPVFECTVSHGIILFFQIGYKTLRIASPKEHEKKEWKREGAGRKKSPALAKITKEINQKQWRANHHYIYLENSVFFDLAKGPCGGNLRKRFKLCVIAARFGAQAKT